MNRRDILRLAGAAASASFGAARAQTAAQPEIGYLSYSALAANPPLLAAFREGLAQEGFVEGRNLAIAFRSADGQAARLPELAAELVRRKVAVIAATGGAPSAAAAKRATDSIPIVFVSGADPVDMGLVSSFNRPGGNVTGIYFQLNELVAKRMQLLREMLPAAQRIAVLVNPGNPTNTAPTLREIADMSRSPGPQFEVLRATDNPGIEAALAAAAAWRAEALFIGPDAFFTSQRAHLVALAERHRLPTSFSQRLSAEAGGLMSYGVDIADSNRQAGAYVGRILKGEKPGDLPVMQPTRYELVINLKTARALGLTVPPALIARADEVIE